MSITTVVFLFIFTVCLVGSIFYHPILGIIGYIISYILYPATQWWTEGIAHLGLRYSLIMAIAIAAGILVHHNKFNFRPVLYLQEALFGLLIFWIWLSTYTGLPQGYFPEFFEIKLLKVAIFLWMLLRVVNTKKQYEIVLWTIIFTTTYLGYDALFASTEYYGRLDRGVGGSDFAESNFLAAHFAMVLPFIGYFFVNGDKKKKILCLICAVLIVNAFVLCRSRGAFLAIGIGVLSSLIFVPKGWRTKTIILLIIGLIGSLQLVDKDFIERMKRINFDVTNVEAQDSSASGRILAWRAAIEMAKDYPLGIGQDNFKHYVEDYQPAIPGKDTHNTYLRALAELGIPGIILILTMILNAFLLIRKQKRRIDKLKHKHKLNFHLFSLTIAVVIFLTAALFITETYIEEFYWILMFPLLLQNVVNHEMTTQEVAEEQEPSENSFPGVAVRANRN